MSATAWILASPVPEIGCGSLIRGTSGIPTALATAAPAAQYFSDTSATAGVPLRATAMASRTVLEVQLPQWPNAVTTTSHWLISAISASLASDASVLATSDMVAPRRCRERARPTDVRIVVASGKPFDSSPTESGRLVVSARSE